MPRDFYADGRELAEHLREAGFEGWAQRIDAVIDEGFSATEILMGLRWTASKLLEAEGLPPECKILPSRSLVASTMLLGKQVRGGWPSCCGCSAQYRLDSRPPSRRAKVNQPACVNRVTQQSELNSGAVYGMVRAGT